MTESERELVDNRILAEKENTNLIFKTTVGAVVTMDNFLIEFGIDGLDLIRMGTSARITL